MSDFLFGGERSGTPVETRAGTQDLANMLREAFRGGPEGFNEELGFGRMTSEAMVNMLGFDPSAVGLNEAAVAALTDPRNQTAGLFAALEPFERRETERAVAENRNLFGAMGGRFGSGIRTGERELRGELAERFARTREQALLQASAQRNDALSRLLGAAITSRGQAFTEAFTPFQTALSFFAPGAPVIQQGAFPGLLSAGINLLGLRMLAGQGQNPGAPGGVDLTGQPVPTSTPTSGGVPAPFTFPFG